MAAPDWRAAVRAAGELLVAEGTSTDAYTDEMIQNVVDNGPYIVIAPGFAFAHARPSPAVRRTGMSWVRLAEPVEFGHDANDPVDLVVALAAQDSAAHTDAMAALARLLADPEQHDLLQSAATPAALHALLRAHDGVAEPEAAPGKRKRPRTPGAPGPSSTRSSPSAATASAPASS